MSVDENFEAIWQKLDQYNTDCRQAERELLNAMQLIAATQPHGYVNNIKNLTNGLLKIYQQGGVLYVSSKDHMYYILDNKKGEPNGKL